MNGCIWNISEIILTGENLSTLSTKYSEPDSGTYELNTG
jgi:hypothetical protein